MSWIDAFVFGEPTINISPYGHSHYIPYYKYNLSSINPLKRREYHEWIYQAIKTSEQAKILNRNSKDRYRYNHNTQTYTRVN